MIELFRRRRLLTPQGFGTQDEQEYPQEYVDVTKLFIEIEKKDGANKVTCATYMREYPPIEDVSLITFNRVYDFRFSGINFVTTRFGTYIASYYWEEPVKVTVTQDKEVFVGES